MKLELTESLVTDGEDRSLLLSSRKSSSESSLGASYSSSYTSETNGVPSETKETQSRSCCRKRPWVEVPLFLYLLIFRSVLPLKELAILSHTEKEYARELNLTRSPSLNTMLESEIQRKSAQFLALLNVVAGLPGLVSTLLLLSLTDISGRKIGLFLPCVGTALKILLYSITIGCDLPNYVLYIAEVFEGLGGSITTAQCVGYVYMSDIVHGDHKTFRFAILQSLFFVGTSIGNVITGHLVASCGFLNSFIFFLGLCILNMLIVIFFLEESNPSTEDETKASFKTTCIEAIKSFRIFSCCNSKENSVELLNSSSVEKEYHSNNTLVILWCLCIAFMMDNFCLYGRNDVDELYMVKSPFLWSSITIGYFQAARYGLTALGTVVLGRLFQSCLHDAWLGILGGISGLVGNLVMAFAYNSVMLWMVTWLSMFSGLISPVASSMMSHYIPPSQQSALFTCLGLIDAFCNLLSDFLFDLIYSFTVHSFSGAVFVLIATLYGVAGFFFIIHLCLMRCDRKEDESTTEKI